MLLYKRQGQNRTAATGILNVNSSSRNGSKQASSCLTYLYEMPVFAYKVWPDVIWRESIARASNAITVQIGLEVPGI
jgi:hypothetical protein